LIVRFSKDSKEYLKSIKKYISKDSKSIAVQYVSKLTTKIKTLLQYPKIGQISKIYNDEVIREIFVDGYKVIYKINDNSILVLMIYKNIDFDESSLF
jgi:plasmid stabilization system protein ParE